MGALIGLAVEGAVGAVSVSVDAAAAAGEALGMLVPMALPL